MLSLGMDLNRPADLLAPGKYPFLKNVHSYQEGRLETRGPVSALTLTPSSPDTEIKSSVRVNDYVQTNFTRFLKIGSDLYYGDTSYTHLDSGYSPLPFSPVAYRPDQSARVWAYLGDPTKMRKANTSGDNYQIGVAPPITIPTAALGTPLYTAPTIFDAATSWTVGGDAGAVTLAARLTGVTIGAILYDTGTSGWACIAPTGGNYQDITVGMRLVIAGAEACTVEESFKIFDTGSNTIAQILYDSGTSGLCTIQPTAALTGIRRNAMIKLGGSEYVRVISVTNAQNGISSFRCSTTGTFAATNALAPPASGSIRVFTTGTRAATNTLAGNILQSTLTFSTGAAYLAYNQGASGFNLSNISNHPLGPDDYMHLGLMVDKPQNITEIKLILDVDSNTSGSFNANDGNQNAYYKSFRPNDLANVINQGVTSDTARSAAITLQQQNDILTALATNQNPASPFGAGQDSTPADVPSDQQSVPPLPTAISPSSQLALGQSQYTEFTWKLAELVRIGSAQAIALSNVRAIQIRITFIADCVITYSNLWVGGGYGPDTANNLTPIIYRYRYRGSATGAHSRPGPAMRSGIITNRQQVNLTAVASTDPQVDKIDWERLGGNNLTWNYLGTSPNSSPTFVDEQLSAAIVVNPPLAVDAFQPFPLSDKPRVLTVTVAGTAILRTGGDAVNSAWTRGTAVIINGQYTTLYAAPVGSLMQVADSVGSGTGLTMEIPEPILDGQPLPYIWGPFEDRVFACGNVLDVGSVYFTEFGDPDSAPDTNRVEVCSPSEVLVHGTVYDGRSYVWSDTRMFALVPSFNAASKYNVVPVPNAKGLWAPYALTTGPRIWFLANDGIYETDGGSIAKISMDLDPIFPNGDRAGYAVNGLYPVKMLKDSGSEITYLRLTYHNGELFFDYHDCHDDPQTLCYDIATKAWYYYKYFENATTPTKVVFHTSETSFVDSDAQTQLVVGTDIGKLYKCDGNGSGVEAIKCLIRTPTLDVGDSRAKKIYGDIVYDMDTNGVLVTCTPYINNYETALTGKTYSNLIRGITDPTDLSSGVGQFARNLGVEIAWTLAT
jgi:hypothetical protein